MTEVTVFGGGCFWCTEAVFKIFKGVVSVTPGYAGGKKPNPTYDEVCSGETGHAEVTRIEFDPTKVSFRTLLTVFFATHDPTTLNRQGNDIGTQYRSIILYTTSAQREEAEAFIHEIEGSTTKGGHVVTDVQPLASFYEAEDYHKDYFVRNPHKAYCELVISPKVEKVQKEFAELLKTNNHSSMKSDHELSSELRRVARDGGTEAPFTGVYVDTHEKGMYTCAICGAELFSSDTKFDSGTGWPSFTNPANLTHVESRKDIALGLQRTEVVCKNCGAHLGHVFNDGPKEQGGKRYCINSICLEFKKEDTTSAA